MKLGEPPKGFRGDYAFGHEDKEHYGLMVIKESEKTRAKQRKGAISNWKVMVNCFVMKFFYGPRVI